MDWPFQAEKVQSLAHWVRKESSQELLPALEHQREYSNR